MRNWTRVLLIGLCLVVPVILLGCSSLDDDTGPTDPGGGTGNNPPAGGSSSFFITVYANPPWLEATGADISKITALIRNEDTGRQVPNGTVVNLHTTLGTLSATSTEDDGALNLSLVAFGGRVEAFLTSGTRIGTAVVTASVGRSSGSADVPFVAPPEG